MGDGARDCSRSIIDAMTTTFSRGLTVLDEINWSRRFHAYALATDTPGYLRRITSDDSEEFREAMAHVYSAVIHQGTIYPATAPTVQCLLEILQDMQRISESSDVTRLTKVLECIGAVGESVAGLEVEPAVASDPAEVERFYELLRAKDDAAWALESTVDTLMRSGCIELQALADEVVAVLLGFSDYPNYITQIAALGAAAWWMQQPAAKRHLDAFAAMAHAAAATPNRDGRATAIMALGDVGVDVARWLEDGDPAIRACAALALPEHPQATAELIDALGDPNAVDLWFTERPARFPAHVRFTLIDSLLSRSLPFERILPAAVSVARAAHAMTADYDWGLFLLAAFPDVSFTAGIRPPPPSTLTDAQRAFLLALVANESLWDPTSGNANLARMRVGLPNSRTGVAALAQTCPAPAPQTRA
jgi:hypothetical protein